MRRKMAEQVAVSGERNFAFSVDKWSKRHGIHVFESPPGYECLKTSSLWC
jgi:hypothetical protein